MDQVNTIQDARMKINSIPGSRGFRLQMKFEPVFQKNDGFMKLRQLYFALINGGGTFTTEIFRNPIVLSAYTHAPFTFVDLERSFSDYKCILTDRRHNLTVENTEKHVIVMHNSRFF